MKQKPKYGGRKTHRGNRGNAKFLALSLAEQKWRWWRGERVEYPTV